MTPQPDIFLSYNREDQAVAKLFAATCEAQYFIANPDERSSASHSFDPTVV